jgi:hypothetical protein
MSFGLPGYPLPRYMERGGVAIFLLRRLGLSPSWRKLEGDCLRKSYFRLYLDVYGVLIDKIRIVVSK